MLEDYSVIDSMSEAQANDQLKVENEMNSREALPHGHSWQLIGDLCSMWKVDNAETAQKLGCLWVT